MANESGHTPAAGHPLEHVAGQMFSIEIVRGSSGFGFTIADSVQGQKVSVRGWSGEFEVIPIKVLMWQWMRWNDLK